MKIYKRRQSQTIKPGLLPFYTDTKGFVPFVLLITTNLAIVM